MDTLTRVARTAAATLEHTFLVGEVGTDSTTAVAVAVTAADGTELAAGAGVSAGQGRYTFPLPGQPQLLSGRVDWSGTVAGAAVVESDQLEVVGGFLFDLVRARSSDDSLKDTTRYPTADLERARVEVELECEWICAQAWVPRYRRVVLDGTGTPDLVLPDGGDEVRGGVLMRGVRTIRSASVAPRVGLPAVDLTAEQLAALTVRAGGVLRRTDGNVWTAGDSNVVVDYEYGSDGPPPDLVRGALTRLRSVLQLNRTQVPDRAVSFTITDLGTYRLSLPDAFRTGLPEVDAAYGRYSRRVSPNEAPGGRQVPASRTMTYDPQHWSMFHGGRP
jgi:hypothetical protein